MINDIKARKLEDVPVGELFQLYSDSFKIKNRITTGTRILVSKEMNCWTCHKPFMSVGFQTTCSERCEDIGAIQEDEARN